MKRCPSCKARFYESTASKAFVKDADGEDMTLIACPACHCIGPFVTIELGDILV